MNKLILGTVQLGLQYGINNTFGQPSLDVAHDILSLAYQNQLEYIDTAFEYGEAQDIICNFQQKRNIKFKIITKITDKIHHTTLANFASSLPNNQVDICLLHNASDINTSALDNLYQLQAQGYIDKIGVSIYSNQELRQAIEHPYIQVIQLPYNLLDNTTQKGGLLRQAKEAGKIIHIRSVFLQGLFFKQLDKLPIGLKPLKPYLVKIMEIAKSAKLSMAELALNYVYHNPYIDGVLIGVETPEQLLMNLDSIQPDFPEDIAQQINHINVKDITLLNPSNW